MFRRLALPNHLGIYKVYNAHVYEDKSKHRDGLFTFTIKNKNTIHDLLPTDHTDYEYGYS